MTTPEGSRREGADFIGAKAVLLHGGRLLTYLRDDFVGLPWRGHWDLPGGGREGVESAEACVLRELYEEFGLILPPERLEIRRDFLAMDGSGRLGVCFAGRLRADDIAAIRFGTEGQRWEMMEVAAFLHHPLAVPALKERVGLLWPLMAASGGEI